MHSDSFAPPLRVRVSENNITFLSLGPTSKTFLRWTGWHVGCDMALKWRWLNLNFELNIWNLRLSETMFCNAFGWVYQINSIQRWFLGKAQTWSNIRIWVCEVSWRWFSKEPEVCSALACKRKLPFRVKSFNGFGELFKSNVHTRTSKSLAESSWFGAGR